MLMLFLKIYCSHYNNLDSKNMLISIKKKIEKNIKKKDVSEDDIS